jgi:hypothetical protein
MVAEVGFAPLARQDRGTKLCDGGALGEGLVRPCQLALQLVALADEGCDRP